jgi:hypothetical protein
LLHLVQTFPVIITFGSAIRDKNKPGAESIDKTVNYSKLKLLK